MENTVKLVVCAGAGVFSLAHLLAAGVQVFRGPRLSHIAMSLGAVGLLCAVLACFLGWRLDWLAALASCGLICGAAVQNGSEAGSVHLSHHITRAAFALLLVLGFLRV